MGGHVLWTFLLGLLPARFFRSDFTQVMVHGLALPLFLLFGTARLAHTVWRGGVRQHTRDVSSWVAACPERAGCPWAGGW